MLLNLRRCLASLFKFKFNIPNEFNFSHTTYPYFPNTTSPLFSRSSFHKHTSQHLSLLRSQEQHRFHRVSQFSKHELQNESLSTIHRTDNGINFVKILLLRAYTLAPLAESVEIVDTAFKAIFNQKNTIKSKGAYFVDLRRNNFNTSVKFQGWKCVNGYAYAVADLMDMLSLQTNVGWGAVSAQALTDCSSDASLSVDNRNQGCGGGLLNNSLIYAVKKGVYELNNYAINN